MITPTSFDWYKLSKIQSHKPNLDEFGSLIKYAHFGEELSRVPNSLRLKLLICFQNASKEIKNEYDKTEEELRQLEFGKKIVSQRINTLEQELESSIQKINTDKAVMDDKKRTLNKLKDKMKAKQIEKQSPKTERSEENYFCPFCTKDDFKSRDTFTFHMYKEHANNINNVIGKEQNESGLAGELKEFILNLKDKEIELMEMMLNKKKEMQTMELEYVYSQQIQKITTQNNFNHRNQHSLTSFHGKEGYSDYEESEELKGESQHLFYQRDNPQAAKEFEHEKHEENEPTFDYFQERNKTKESSNKYVPPPQREIVQKNDYYNIFQDEKVEQSDRSLSSRTDGLQKSEEPSIQVHTEYELPKSHVIKTPTVLNQVTRNLSWNQSPIPLQNQPIKPSTQSKLYAYPNPNNPNDSSMSQISDKKYDSFYRGSKSNIRLVNDGHIFNSGPLVDDIGDGSDYEDYFEKDMTEDEEQIEDEEIKIMNPIATFKNVEHKKEHTDNNYQSVTKPIQNLSIGSYEISQLNNQSNFILEYSKDKSLLDLSNSKEKSSDLIDLSNSFSKHGYESSKNNESSINLSDLKLSKLEKQREAAKKEKFLSKEAEEPSEIQISINPSAFDQKSSKYKGNPQILQEFTREEPPQQEKNMRRTEKPLNNLAPNNFKMPENINFLKTNPGILDQFFIENKGKSDNELN